MQIILKFLFCWDPFILGGNTFLLKRWNRGSGATQNLNSTFTVASKMKAFDIFGPAVAIYVIFFLQRKLIINTKSNL